MDPERTLNPGQNVKKKNVKYKLSEIKNLGIELLSSRAHINNLPLLISFISPDYPTSYALESLLSLQSFFSTILPQLPSYSSTSSVSAAEDDPELIYRTWIRTKFDEFVKSLIDVMTCRQSDVTLRDVMLETLMELVKMGNKGKFHSSIYHRFLHSIVHSSIGVDFLLEALALKYFKFLDVRFFTYISIKALSKTLEEKNMSGNAIGSLDGNISDNISGAKKLSIQKLHFLLSHIPPLEALNDESGYETLVGSGSLSEEGGSLLVGSKAKQKKAMKSDDFVLSSACLVKKLKPKFTQAWISFLRLPLPLDVYKEVLVSLPHLVIPHLSKPIILCDFLTKSYDIGGVISVMALGSLYILMTQHALEYPKFYEKLYALLVPSIFMAKHRANFFQLLDSCLKSPLLPAYLAAAFTKKLSRLALSVPPSGELVIIALIHNLLRRHPSINCLVHSVDGKDDTDKTSAMDMCFDGLGVDQFKDEESDPMKCDAMRSSLWELDTLRHHYCPPVSRFVLSLENDLTVKAKTSEIAVSEFCSGSYGTVFAEEIRRRIKHVPCAFYKSIPTSLFSEKGLPGWAFKCEDGSIDSSKRQRIDHS